MHRRLLIAALGCWPATRVLAQDEPANKPHHKVSANELRKAMAVRFPVRFSVAGLVNVQVDVPDLRLLPARQRLGATARVTVEDLSTRQVHSGEMDLVFALRCEPADRTLRAHHLEVAGLRSPTLPPRAAQRWQALLASFTRGAVDEIVLHRFSSDELALADTLGFQPEQITVEDDGVVIWFAPRANG
jgi:hypothetical protein